MNKIIKSSIFLVISYVVISLSLYTFGDWYLKDSITFFSKVEYGWFFLISFIIITLVSAKISEENSKKLNLVGYIILPFVYSVTFVILFMKAETSVSSCSEGMGCGLVLIAAIAFAVLQFVLLVINYGICRRK